MSNSDHCESIIQAGRSPDMVVGVGSSAGGLGEVVLIAQSLTQWFNGTLVIANHRMPESENRLRDILAGKATVEVEEPEDEDCLEKSTIYVGNARDVVEVDGPEFDVNENTSKRSRLRRIDDLFFSVAKSAGPNGIGIVLSGALSDGAAGLKAIHDAGGVCMVQHPKDAAFDSMPVHALEEVPTAFVGTTEEIITHLMELSIGRDQSGR